MENGLRFVWTKFVARWLKFNFVGVIGAFLQLALLAAACIAGWPYLFATVVAVECTILHNFLWHERFTWADRRCSPGRERVLRLLRFNASNGAVSLFGNLMLMRLLVEQLHWPVLLANGTAIIACSLINFMLGDQFVFPGPFAHSVHISNARNGPSKGSKMNGTKAVTSCLYKL